MSTGPLPGLPEEARAPAWARERSETEDAGLVERATGAGDELAGLANRLAARRAALLERIEGAGGDLDRVRVVAVTKGFPPATVAAALAVGFEDIGENYAQELVTKAAAVELQGASPRWHYLGRLQRNKLSRLAPLVHLYQGVSSVTEGVALVRRVPAARVLVEVDMTGVRQGCTPGEASAVVDALRSSGLVVAGLMTVAPPGGGSEAARAFRTLARLASSLSLAELSMGMSDDLELAVAEGSTMVRVGRALFGPRPARPGLRQ